MRRVVPAEADAGLVAIEAHADWLLRRQRPAGLEPEEWDRRPLLAATDPAGMRIARPMAGFALEPVSERTARLSMPGRPCSVRGKIALG